MRTVLEIGGVVPFTTADWPGRLAAVVFVQGCPWRCGYCHNPHLLPAAKADAHAPDWEDVCGFLDRRRGLLDGIVLSGGEPTAQPALLDAILEIRARGFAVALHTAGIYPRRLQRVLPYVDWIGFDLKAPQSLYAKVTGIASSDAPAFESLDLVRNSGVAFEVRTTVHPALLSWSALESMAEALAARGVERWVLQPFRATGCDDATLRTGSSHAMLAGPGLERLAQRVPDIFVRA